MKRTFELILTMAMGLSTSMIVFTPKTMSDGQILDPIFFL